MWLTTDPLTMSVKHWPPEVNFTSADKILRRMTSVLETMLLYLSRGRPLSRLSVRQPSSICFFAGHEACVGEHLCAAYSGGWHPIVHRRKRGGLYSTAGRLGILQVCPTSPRSTTPPPNGRVESPAFLPYSILIHSTPTLRTSTWNIQCSIPHTPTSNIQPPTTPQPSHIQNLTNPHLPHGTPHSKWGLGPPSLLAPPPPPPLAPQSHLYPNPSNPVPCASDSPASCVLSVGSTTLAGWLGGKRAQVLPTSSHR